MITKKGLTDLGFSLSQAESLLQNTEFVLRVKNKNNQEFKELFETIKRVYGAATIQIVKAILSHPRFADYNHSRVLANIQRRYGVSKTQATKTILSRPQFAGYNHSRVLRDITRAYLPEEEYKAANLKQKKQIVKQIRTQATKAILSYPSFASYNHRRVLRDITRAYLPKEKFQAANSEQKKQIIKKLRTQATKAILSHHPFAGYNHSRVLRQALRLGRKIGLNRTEIINAIFDNPVLAGYSQRRNLAAIDATRNAVNRTGSTKTNKELFEIYQKNYIESPYFVKGSKKSETWWERQRRKPPEKTTSKMGRQIEKRLKKPRRTRVLR